MVRFFSEQHLKKKKNKKKKEEPLVSRTQRAACFKNRSKKRFQELLVSRIQRKDVLSCSAVQKRKENTGSLNRRTPSLLNNGIVYLFQEWFVSKRSRRKTPN